MKRLLLVCLLLAFPAIVHAQGVEASKIRRTTFVSLGTATNGQERRCTNCAITAVTGVCASGGAGAWAYADGTNWICSTHAPGGGGGGITNSALVNQVMISDGTNATGDSDLTFVTDTLTTTKLGATTLTGTVSGGGQQLNNIIIGTVTPLAGSFTTLTASGVVTAGSGPTTLTDSAGKVLSAALNTVAVANGGTGIASGTSGGVPYYSGSTTIASSGALTANKLVKGGGAGAAPAASLATDNGTTLDYSGTGGITAPSLTTNGAASGAVLLNGLTSGGVAIVALDVAGTAIAYALPSTNGAANQFLMENGAITCPTLIAGMPATCHGLVWTGSSGTGNVARVVSPAFTTPALGTPSALVLTNATGLPAAGGGTGQSTYTKGDILASPGSNTLNKLAVGTDGQVLTADAASTNGIKWATAAGGGTPCTTTALSLQYNNAGSFGCISTTTTDGSIVTHSANGIGATSTDRIVLSNTTAAANNAQQWSPAQHFIAQGWDGSGSVNNQVEFFQELVPFQNNSDGFADFLMTWSVKRAGGTKTALLRFGPEIRQAIGSGVDFYPGGVTPSNSNYAISINAGGASTILNAATAVYLQNASNTELIANANGVQINNGLGVDVAPPVGGIAFTKTITAGGTTGAQTINKTTGTVNFAAAATSLVVTNNQVGTSSIIFGVLRTADATCRLASIVPAAGSFTINMTGACTAETSVGFFVSN